MFTDNKHPHLGAMVIIAAVLSLVSAATFLMNIKTGEKKNAEAKAAYLKVESSNQKLIAEIETMKSLLQKQSEEFSQSIENNKKLEVEIANLQGVKQMLDKFGEKKLLIKMRSNVVELKKLQPIVQKLLSQSKKFDKTSSFELEKQIEQIQFAESKSRKDLREIGVLRKRWDTLNNIDKVKNDLKKKLTKKMPETDEFFFKGVTNEQVKMFDLRILNFEVSENELLKINFLLTSYLNDGRFQLYDFKKRCKIFTHDYDEMKAVKANGIGMDRYTYTGLNEYVKGSILFPLTNFDKVSRLTFIIMGGKNHSLSRYTWTLNFNF